MDLNDMSRLIVTPRIRDGEWRECLGDSPLHGIITQVGNLPRGTDGGSPSFALIARLDDGSTVVVETTWRLMRGALRALDAAWPEYQV